jgi:beta-lactamase superfamily II metal-dependent hydrolase
MDDKLLIRVYDVGFGDCIYVRIPDGDGYFHMLIDCGTSASADPREDPSLKNALDNVRSMLPQDHEGKRCLDLLVATHPHADHIKGFDPNWFQDVQIERIWLSAFMKLDHPQAQETQAFQDLANDAASSLLERRGLGLAPGVQALLMRSIWNPGALQALREDLAQASGIYPQYPLYLSRDLAERLSAAEMDAYKLDLRQGTTCFLGFQEPETCLRVLAPEWDIDRYYLGQGIQENHSLIDHYLLRTEAYRVTGETLIHPASFALQEDAASEAGAKTPAVRVPRPGNISEQDFRQLRHRLLYSALAFSQMDDALKNNVSVVLLLEWRGRRLLFAGDAEWQGTGVQEQSHNSSWDVMLHNPEVEQILLQPLDFFKVAHHGSHNGTPFLEGGKERVLRKLLSPDRSQVVVSTVHGKHGRQNPVPYPALLAELGRRSANKQEYEYDPEPDLRGVHQPQRTDLESPIAGEKARYVQVTLAPNAG